MSPRLFHARHALLASFFLLLLGTIPARADSTSRKALTFASGTGNLLYLAAGLGLPLAEDGADGKDHALRALDSLGVSVGIAEITKLLVKERRPDRSNHESFPIGHATAAFAVAAVESEFHRNQAPYWYLGATLISASRVGLHVHYIHDVVAGALLGYGVSRLELAQTHGLVLSPLIGRSGDNGMALQFTRRF